MTKNEIIEKIVRELHLPHVKGKIIVDIIIDEMTEALRKGNNIQLRGLGSFVVKTRQSMRRRHPGTGKMITIPKQKVVRFIPGKNLKVIK